MLEDRFLVSSQSQKNRSLECRKSIVFVWVARVVRDAHERSSPLVVVTVKGFALQLDTDCGADSNVLVFAGVSVELVHCYFHRIPSRTPQQPSWLR